MFIDTKYKDNNVEVILFMFAIEGLCLQSLDIPINNKAFQSFLDFSYKIESIERLCLAGQSVHEWHVWEESILILGITELSE